MKFLSENLRFYIIITQVFCFSCLIFPIDYGVFLKPFTTPILKYLHYFWLLCFNSLAFIFFYKIYTDLKIHHLKKASTYPEILDLLKAVRAETKAAKPISTVQNAEGKKENQAKNKEYTLLQKHLPAYAWFRNSHSQKALNALVSSILLLGIIIFLYNSFMLVLLAAGLALFGLAKIMRGYIEVV